MRVMTGVFALVYAGLIVWLLVWKQRCGTTVALLDAPLSEIQLKAIDCYFSKLQNLGSLALALTGALWALVIYPKDAAVSVIDKWRLMLVIIATLFFLTSFVLYSLGYDFLIGRMFFHDTFDLEAPIVQFWSDSQSLCFAFGVASFLLIILACRRRPGVSK